MRASFSAWIEAEGQAQGLSADTVKSYGLANPLGMSADGLQRYWRKVKAPTQPPPNAKEHGI
jgi:hypothetical protein